MKHCCWVSARFCLGGGNHYKRSMVRENEPCSALWRCWVLSKPPSGHFSRFNRLHFLYTYLSNPGPSSPTHLDSNFSFTSEIPRHTLPQNSAQQTAGNAEVSFYHIVLNMVCLIFWGGNRGAETATYKDSLHFFFKIILFYSVFVARLNHFDLHFTQNVYKACGQI